MHYASENAPLVQCDTCGNLYHSHLVRCPRCQSNQKSAHAAPREDLGFVPLSTTGSEGRSSIHRITRNIPETM